MELVNAGTKRQVAMKKKSSEDCEENADPTLNTKRSAESLPDLGNKKRAILGNITNAKNSASSVRTSSGGNAKTSKTVKSSISSLDGEAPTKEIIDSTVVIERDETSSVNPLWAPFPIPPVPSGVADFDKLHAGEVNCEPKYAAQIFAYYKQREKKFVLEKYMPQQPEVTKGMRACLIDWLVEVQESFELNHETLYLAVKIIDLYLMKHKITKATLQLVGATAMLIAAKYDERIPPVIDDFLYVCDDSYSRPELIAMEVSILRTIDFDLGIPISYRFLRRYARCSGVSMETLTLARFILETALMDYDLIDVSDSKIAAAAFLLALRMKNIGKWTPTLQYYSGYKAEELEDLSRRLNKNISNVPNKNLMTVRNKYTHQIFFEVAKIPPLLYIESSA